MALIKCLHFTAYVLSTGHALHAGNFVFRCSCANLRLKRDYIKCAFRVSHFGTSCMGGECESFMLMVEVVCSKNKTRDVLLIEVFTKNGIDIYNLYRPSAYMRKDFRIL
jgi:hypothetical protein